jgi:hypothetical protein
VWNFIKIEGFVKSRMKYWELALILLQGTWGIVQNLAVCRRYRRKKGVSYYSFYTERFANWLGELVTGEEAVR